MHMIMTSCRNVISIKNTANAMFIHAMFNIQMQNKFTVLNYSAFFLSTWLGKMVPVL